MGIPRLPDELFVRIVEYLDHNLSLHDWPHDRAGTSTWALYRHTLVAVTKTGNRRLNAIATHRLYHTIDIPNMRVLHRLLRTLVRADHLAKTVRAVLIQGLSTLFDELLELVLADITPGLEAHASLARCFTGLSPDSTLRRITGILSKARWESKDALKHRDLLAVTLSRLVVSSKEKLPKLR